MLFIVIGIFVAVAVGAFLRQQSRHSAQEQQEEAIQPEAVILDLPDDDEEPEYTLTAKPVTSPELVSGATYSSHAPAGEESPYGRSASEAKPKPQAQPNLLRWCGRTGNIQLDKITIPGPAAYWSNGEPATPEPSCIDITLPVAFPQIGDPLPAEGAESYAGMTELQRGIYLTWLSGARIQPPIHACYPAMWLYGIERRTIVDKLDLTMCLNDVFRLLPLLRWEALSNNIVKFITWLAVKIWLPDEDLLGFCKRLNNVPEGLLDILLNSYANSMLPLPSAVAFTVIRTSTKLRREGQPIISHSDELLQKFTPIYKEICNGGLILSKPQSTLKIDYKPSNPSIKLGKKDNDPVEIPDFFENLSIFKPLLDSWEVFLAANKVEEKTPDLSNIAERPDFEGFINTLRPEGSDLPLISTLQEIGKLMKFDISQPKLNGKERKAIVDTAQVEGWQILPDLGVSGRLYRWQDRILLQELEPGTQLSHGYRVASFMLEFMCASLAVDEDRVFEPLRQRMNECFPLTEEDNIRLEGQKPLNLSTQYGPEYYGDFLCEWLSDTERKTLRNFILGAVSFLPEFGDNPEVNSVLCEFLRLDENEEIPEQELNKSLKERGKETMKVLSPLFKNN